MKTFFSPGRVNIIGEHIDYNGGYVLPVALNIGTCGKVWEIKEKLLRIKSLNFVSDGVCEINFNENLVKENNWFDYVKAVIDVLQKRGYVLDKGLEIEIEGNIPNSSGLSSSASLEVLICYILNHYNNLNISREDIAVICKEAENNFVGVNCGIMDQFIISTGIDKKAIVLNCDTLDYKYIDCDLNEYVIVVMNSKKQRGLVDSEYNARRQECESSLKKINVIKPGVNYLCELSIDDLDDIKPLLNENEYKRSKHAITEQDRVIKASEALKSKDIDTLAKLMLGSHDSLKNDYEVSCFELDTLVDLAMEHGALGARMTGAGFGGCAIALVKTNDVDSFLAKVIPKYKKICSLDGEAYIVNVGNGVMEID